ncbi:MAG TPA: right-handed parallel beta-helix repeat-containing protein [Pseudonocardiaceae bacterium]|jgi:hypothetical protein
MVGMLALGIALVGSGVSAAGVAGAATLARQSCTRMVSRPVDVASALGAARAGDVLCFTGKNLAAADLVLTRSGTAAAPVSLVADGAAVHRIAVAANNVLVQGFTVAGGDELLLQGSGITARHNTVRDTQRGGIICDPCFGSSIDSNTVRRAAQVGIFITGQRIAVTGNDVSATVPRGTSDADGIRFLGDGHRIIGNTIHDIYAAGYADPPHPDCFQTFESNDVATFDVVISKNSCQRVDAQCLIASADRTGNSGAPAGVRTVTFLANICSVGGAQAVNLRHWPNAEVRGNRITGRHMYRGILAVEGSTGCRIVDNTTGAGIRPVEVDNSSLPGCVVSGNGSRARP